MTVETCAFETSRLRVSGWHVAPAGGSGEGLAAVVASILTEPVARALPDALRGGLPIERAAAWIAERDAEGPTLLVVDRSSGQPIGLMILFESEAAGGVEVRLGYVLAEQAWGKGLASELIEGFVSWCRAQIEIRSVAGGVARDNPASARVLEKSGFRAVGAERDASADAPCAYRLVL